MVYWHSVERKSFNLRKRSQALTRFGRVVGSPSFRFNPRTTSSTVSCSEPIPTRWTSESMNVSVPKERLGKKSRTPIAKAPGKRPIIVFKKCENISEYYKTPEGPCLGLIQTSLPVKLFPVPWQCALAETSVRL